MKADIVILPRMHHHPGLVADCHQIAVSALMVNMAPHHIEPARRTDNPDNRLIPQLRGGEINQRNVMFRLSADHVNIIAVNLREFLMQRRLSGKLCITYLRNQPAPFHC